MKTTKIHFIEEETDEVVLKILAFNVPSQGDEIRFGGEGNEKYYTVTRRVFVYDEEYGVEIDRVNVGVERAET